MSNSGLEHINLPPCVNVKTFVLSALKLTGPLSLPYPSSNHHTITKHFIDLHELFPSMHPIIKTEVDSVVEELKNYLEASGVLPFVTKKVTYHVPISISLPNSYPILAPSVMIIPNTHMFVNLGNPHVDHFGRVTIPYTKNWNPSSSLDGLCTSLSALFSDNPPVFTHKIPPGVSLWTSKAKKQSPILCPLPSAPPRDVSDEAHQKFIKVLENNLCENVEKDIDRIRDCESEKAEKASIAGLHTTLTEHISKVWKAICEKEGPKEGREEELEYLKKLHELHESADSAVDLVVKRLDKAVDGRKNKTPLPINRYLSAIRTISREQFNHRASAMKIEKLLNEAREPGY